MRCSGFGGVAVDGSECRFDHGAAHRHEHDRVDYFRRSSADVDRCCDRGSRCRDDVGDDGGFITVTADVCDRGNAGSERADQSDRRVELDAATVLATIPVTNETPAGYDRRLFDEWETDPATGCIIRDTVLLPESITPATLTTGCVIANGQWLSAYDNVTVTNPSALDVDHLVPLKEAWDSGAAAWDLATRAAFANDITDPRTMIAVTASANRSKGDRDPSNWIPPDSSYVCTYVGDWIAVQARWQLTMDQSEAGRLRNLIRDRCPGLTVAQWSPATVPMATAEPETVPESVGTTTPAGQSGNVVYYKNCAAAKAGGVTPLHRGQPGYRTGLDGDGDGVACEH